MLPARMRISIRGRYVPALASGHARAARRGRALQADAIRDGLRLEAIAADVANDGDGVGERVRVLVPRPFEQLLGADDMRITVSALRKRLGEPWLIATVPGVGYRIEGGDRG